MEDPEHRRREQEEPEDEETEQRRRELEIERLMLAQEEEEHAEPPPEEEAPPRQQRLPHGPPTTNKPRLSYTQASFSAALGLVWYALRTRQQWYLALVFLGSSKWAYIILGNAMVALCVSVFRFFTKVFLGGLRLAESEGLGDFFKWNMTEMCLALTMFRSELSVQSGVMFLTLVMGKCLHWVVETREGHLRMTQEAVVPVRRPGLFRGWPLIEGSHVGLFWLLQLLALIDIFVLVHCVQDIAAKGPSVQLLFGCEAAILLVTSMSLTLLWCLHVFDGFLHYLHDETVFPIHGVLHAWRDRKATLVFAIELQAQGFKFLFYLTFFGIVMTYYGLPINLFREVYMSFHALRGRLVAFAKYRRLMASMNRFPSVESEEALDEIGRICIICRDEMTLRDCKQLPGCGHVFHKSCLREWLVQQQTCPTCRADITANDQRERRQRQEQAAAQQRQEQAAAQQRQEQAAAQQQAVNIPPQEAFSYRELPAPGPVAPPRNLMEELEEEPQQQETFPALYRVVANNGADVWETNLEQIRRIVPCGTAVLCQEKEIQICGTEMGMMLRIPDGWIWENHTERVMAIPKTPVK